MRPESENNPLPDNGSVDSLKAGIVKPATELPTLLGNGIQLKKENAGR
jgi:hypothetical protein